MAQSHRPYMMPISTITAAHSQNPQQRAYKGVYALLMDAEAGTGCQPPVSTSAPISQSRWTSTTYSGSLVRRHGIPRSDYNSIINKTPCLPNQPYRGR